MLPILHSKITEEQIREEMLRRVVKAPSVIAVLSFIQNCNNCPIVCVASNGKRYVLKSCVDSTPTMPLIESFVAELGMLIGARVGKPQFLYLPPSIGQAYSIGHQGGSLRSGLGFATIWEEVGMKHEITPNLVRRRYNSLLPILCMYALTDFFVGMQIHELFNEEGSSGQLISLDHENAFCYGELISPQRLAEQRKKHPLEVPGFQYLLDHNYDDTKTHVQVLLDKITPQSLLASVCKCPAQFGDAHIRQLLVERIITNSQQLAETLKIYP